MDGNPVTKFLKDMDLEVWGGVIEQGNKVILILQKERRYEKCGSVHQPIMRSG